MENPVNGDPPGLEDAVPLPEVPLYWSDFVWSLEKLRHRAYSRKMTERDWYRINPLEMVLLGCQTLADDSSASRDHGTFVMKMENLRERMCCIPRYWQRAIAVLFATIKGPETPSLIVQRCAAGIVNIWQGVHSNTLMKPSFVSWAIIHFKLFDVTQFLLTEKKKCLSPSTSEDIFNISVTIQEILSTSKDLISDFQSEASSQEYNSSSPVSMIDLFMHILRSFCKDVSIPSSLDDLKSVYVVFLAYIKDEDWSNQFFLNPEVADRVIELANCISLRTEELDKILTVISNIVVLLASFDVEHSRMSSFLISLVQLFQERSQQLQKDPQISYDLLQLIYTILLSQPIEESLPMAQEFITDYVRLLMTYSVEGYLSDSPVKFFLQLVEFVLSLVEQGTPPSLAIQVNLANLFGPFFGVNSHMVSTALLEYGFLSVCSKHKSALLTDGLQHIVNVWKLFPSIDRDAVQRKALRNHVESLEICDSIINDIVNDVFSDGSSGVSSSSQITIEHFDDTHMSEESSEITRAEQVKDRHERIVVLTHLLNLACSMVRNGDNICYMFASVLPRLFSSAPPTFVNKENREKLIKFFGEVPPPRDTSLMWRVDKKRLAISLLSLSTLSLENEMSTPFELCGIVMPKLARNLDTKNFTDEEKLSLSIDILYMTKEALLGGHGIEEFISHGFELLSSLLPQSISPDELKSFTEQLVQQLVTSGHSSLLFLIRNSCVYMLYAFPEESSQIQQFFHTLIFKGKRNEIRSVFKVCRNPFNEGLFANLRLYLYSYGKGEINNRQLLSLCEIILAVVDVTKSPSSNLSLPEEEEELTDEERNERETKKLNSIEVMKKLVSSTLKDVEEALAEKRFKKDVWESKLSQLSRLALFRTLFSNDLHEFHHHSSEELEKIFENMFPSEVLNTKEAMDILSMGALRIEHMQVPRYSALKVLLTKMIKNYLTFDVAKDLTAPAEKLLARNNCLNTAVLSLERNSNDVQKLTSECFYSEQFWNNSFTLKVKTDGSHSLEENMRQTLLACYSEFANILKEMNITHVSVNGEFVKSVDLFSEELTLSELKGHRSVAVRAIDQKLGGTREGRIHERKVALLTREDDIESDFEKQANAPIKPKTFTVLLNTKFFDCVKCCGGQIIGCYAPNGEHCERPLEIGIRADSGFLSIYDESGTEIENCEILLCNEGLYIFKAYTNGHPYDTSQVWIQAFNKLLEPLPENHSLSLVPAIIIPQNYPNPKTWDLLRRSVKPELTGSLLTCQHDFSPEWRTYYDHRPEKVHCGIDMILHPGFTLSSSDSRRPVYGRQRSRITKDFAGLVFEHVISHLLERDDLKPFRFLGKYMSQYISVLVEEGESRTDIISKGFDYERWVKTQTRTQSSQRKLKNKEEIVAQLVTFIEEKLMEWCLEADVKLMCEQSHKQLLQMRAFLGKWKSTDQAHIVEKYMEIQSILKESTIIVQMELLPRATQEEIIHWIYHNEDRVWRYRGGRCGHETLQQFMGFIGNIDSSNKVYPGVCSFMLPGKSKKDLNIEQDFNVDSLVGYSVGEMSTSLSNTSELPVDCYEVVLGWVNPKYQKLNLSINMYFSIIRRAPASFILCDVIQGSLERIIASNPLLRFLDFVGMAKYIVRRRQQSYTVQLQTGGTEQFEQVIFRVWPIQLAMWFERCFRRILFRKEYPQPLILDRV